MIKLSSSCHKVSFICQEDCLSQWNEIKMQIWLRCLWTTLLFLICTWRCAMPVAPILEKRCSSPTHGLPMEGKMIRGSLQLTDFRQNKLTLLTVISNLRIEHYLTQFWIAPKSKDVRKFKEGAWRVCHARSPLDGRFGWFVKMSVRSGTVKANKKLKKVKIWFDLCTFNLSFCGTCLFTA